MITTGAISISQALMVNQTLLELGIPENNIGDDGITAIAGSLNYSSVTELSVYGCSFSFAGTKSLAEVLSTNQKIRNLYLWGNPITVDGARLITKCAVDNGVCEYVGVSKKYENDEEVKKMMAILKDRSRQNVRI